MFGAVAIRDVVSLHLRLGDIKRAVAWDAAAIVLYAIAAMIYLHPLFAGGIRNFCVGAPESNDPQIFIWGLAWYPYAISHGLDPLFTKLAFAPSGYNLAWSTTIPAPALMLWPITARFGPLVSFNLLSAMVPILSAYAAFALCRHVSKAAPPSLVGGMVYGFSTYQRIEADHLNLALSFIPPLLVLLFVLRVDNRIGRFRYEVLLAACLTLQFLTSPEIFATAILFGAFAISAGWWIGDKECRIRLRLPLRESIVAIAVAVVALSPYIYRFIPSPFGLSPIYNPAHCSSDLLGFLIPTGASLAGSLKFARVLSSRIGYGCEPAAYMGLLPVIAVWLALKPRAESADAFPIERFLALLLIGIVMLALGPVIHVGGATVAPSVWLPALIFPIVNNALPARFVLYGFLTLSVTMTLWLSDTRRRASMRWLVAAAAMLSVLPAAVPAAQATLPFFSQRIYRDYLAPDETVMILPFGYNGEAMKWQAQSNFFFRVAGGYLSVIPHQYQAWPIVPALLADDPYIPGYGDQFKAFLTAHGVGAIIVAETEYARYAKLCATLGAAPLRTGGVVFFRLGPANLTPFDHPTAAEMDTRYNLDRFKILIRAAREFLARGHSYRDLSPFAAARLGLLDTTVAGDRLRAQTTGFPFVRAARASTAFQAVAGYLIAHRMIRERLAVELGPLTADDATTSGIWLGPGSGESIAVGVVAARQAAASLRARFGASADAIYYPYPLRYSEQSSGSDDPQMLLMTFRIAALPALEEPNAPRN